MKSIYDTGRHRHTTITRYIANVPSENANEMNSKGLLRRIPCAFNILWNAAFLQTIAVGTQ